MLHQPVVGIEVAALDLVRRRGRPGEVYNVGGRCERSNLELTSVLLDILGRPRSLVRFVADRPGHDRRYALDSTKLRSLGWAPAHSFDAGLAETVEWYREHREWWEPIKSGAYRAYYEQQYAARLAG